MEDIEQIGEEEMLKRLGQASQSHGYDYVHW